ncbi:lytic transglycosylase domain-containing protein [Streptomyces galbus]|uniref:Lytic transglycosylase domain-containing protein n=1 Tax=Streptomyces galbus TaxID=33898 RepID=A0A4U5X399_STRGB|nr:lytic transglycosylase domain-containing protein [Streptomyces galbus]TKT09497.1 lytic transglycosylase domain-containing protein [Streptomyces galbus]GHD28078.1 lytic transglycosylase [Streptomyces galbus]
MAAQFGRRLRKGAVTTAVAAAAVAALSASQAPDVTADTQERQSAADAQSAPDPTAADPGATGNSPYYTDLPPLNSPAPVPSATVGPTTGTGTSQAGIPATVLDAYQKAAAELAASKPGCNLPWHLLAAIGQVESGQARGGRVTADGTTVSPILGPVLNGAGFAHIKDTDHGAYDGDTTYDRAIGPMQFIPSTWAWAGRDGNGDGKADPNNVYDAALAAGHYLCRNGWDLSVEADLKKAILSYNYSQDYLHTVRSWMEFYRRGTHEIPDGSGSLPGNRSDDHDTPMSPSVPVTPSPTPKPKPKPSTPGTGKPSTPGTPSKPGTPTTPSKPTPTPTPTPTDTVAHLEDAGTATLSARAGDTFADRISTRAETSAGKPVAKVRIRFTIVGDTDATFAGGESHATVVTDAKGVALAPALRAGEKTGDFTVRALLVGRAVTAVDYRATVTARTADALARTGDTALTCTAGGEFADRVELKATYKGAAAGKVAATATLLASADATTAADKGPYFKDASGKPVRTLTGLETDADGVLKLPELYADDTTGTFVLRVTTTGGATLTVELTVTAPASSTPTPSGSPSGSQSPAASQSPSA